jgi:hypothetical protein
MIDFGITAFGNFCNSAPNLRISAGPCVLWSGDISGHREIRCKIPTRELITISGIGKVNGEHGVYDTYVDEQGCIVNDKYLKILDVSIHGISMENQWLDNLDLISAAGMQKFKSNTFWCNGQLTFSVDEPVLDWIIEKKYLQFTQNGNLVADARSGQDKFNYRPMIEQIQKIKSLLNDSYPNL